MSAVALGIGISALILTPLIISIGFSVANFVLGIVCLFAAIAGNVDTDRPGLGAAAVTVNTIAIVFNLVFGLLWFAVGDISGLISNLF